MMKSSTIEQYLSLECKSLKMLSVVIFIYPVHCLILKAEVPVFLLSRDGQHVAPEAVATEISSAARNMSQCETNKQKIFLPSRSEIFNGRSLQFSVVWEGTLASFCTIKSGCRCY